MDDDDDNCEEKEVVVFVDGFGCSGCSGCLEDVGTTRGGSCCCLRDSDPVADIADAPEAGKFTEPLSTLLALAGIAGTPPSPTTPIHLPTVPQLGPAPGIKKTPRQTPQTTK